MERKKIPWGTFAHENLDAFQQSCEQVLSRKHTYVGKGQDWPGEKLDGFIILCLDDLLLKSMSKCVQILLFTQ